eukprot:1175365-Prorocentrum_minimum.AAC.3
MVDCPLRPPTHPSIGQQGLATRQVANLWSIGCTHLAQEAAEEGADGEPLEGIPLFPETDVVLKCQKREQRVERPDLHPRRPHPCHATSGRLAESRFFYKAKSREPNLESQLSISGHAIWRAGRISFFLKPTKSRAESRYRASCMRLVM